jgi:prepilin-type N-terminal cleavage/methylation domain-containing protein
MRTQTNQSGILPGKLGSEIGRNSFVRAFTLVESLLVVVIIGLLAAVAVVKLARVYRDGVADRARTDVSIVNKAIVDWRSDNPSLDFLAMANAKATTDSISLAEAAFQIARPYMALPVGTTTLQQYNVATANHWIYGYRGTYGSAGGGFDDAASLSVMVDVDECVTQWADYAVADHSDPLVGACRLKGTPSASPSTDDYKYGFFAVVAQ